MNIPGEVIRNAQTSTPPVNQKKEGLRGFSLEKLEEACAKRGVSLEETIARYLDLDAEDAEKAKANLVNMYRDQAKMVIEVSNKYVPNLSSTTLEGELDVRVTKVERHIVDPRNSDG